MTSARRWTTVGVRLVVLALVAASSSARADVEMPAIFGDGMVLQCNQRVPVWGRASPGEEVSVAVAGRSALTCAGDDGSWRVDLPSLPAGGPHRMRVRGANTLEFDDVLIGEVWIGSGQSNMQMTVAGCFDHEGERARGRWPRIRFFHELSQASSERQWRGSGRWVACSPETVADFSATLYFFGRELHASLDVPVGLINSSLGGTPIEAWISAEAQYGCPELVAYVSGLDAAYREFDVERAARGYRERRAQWMAEVAAARAEGRAPPKRPRNAAERMLRVGLVGDVFNGKIAPLIPYAIRGAVWYQGEANTPNAGFYRYQLPLLVSDWRRRWGQGDFPFLWVQLPNHEAERGDADWPLVREAMRRALRLPNTGMAVTVDLADPTALHPKNKQDFGQRLAAWALAEVYGIQRAASGPLLACCEITGKRVVARFRFAEGGLVSRGPELAGFEIQGGDGAWHRARARIVGRERVEVESEAVGAPRALRYGWAANPSCNLYNRAGLPASPFTTQELDVD